VLEKEARCRMSYEAQDETDMTLEEFEREISAEGEPVTVYASRADYEAAEWHPIASFVVNSGNFNGSTDLPSSNEFLEVLDPRTFVWATPEGSTGRESDLTNVG